MPASRPVDLGVDTTFPSCPDCPHDWHGLRCAIPVVTVARGGRRTDPCGCLPAEVPGGASAA